MDNIQIQQRNDDGMNAIYKGILYAINQEVKDAPYDRTLIGLVIDVNLENNTYTVVINGKTYYNIMSTIRTYINDTVIVMCPQNQLSQMFIYGKIDTTDYSESEE